MSRTLAINGAMHSHPIFVPNAPGMKPLRIEKRCESPCVPKPIDPQTEAVCTKLCELVLERKKSEIEVQKEPETPKVTVPLKPPVLKRQVGYVKPRLVVDVKKEIASEAKTDDEWVSVDGDVYRVRCPGCGGVVEVKKGQVNCAIFRHGVFKDGSQVPPHSTEAQIKMFRAVNIMEGCGAPFKLIDDGKEGKIAITCGYV